MLGQRKTENVMLSKDYGYPLFIWWEKKPIFWKKKDQKHQKRPTVTAYYETAQFDSSFWNCTMSVLELTIQTQHLWADIALQALPSKSLEHNMVHNQHPSVNRIHNSSNERNSEKKLWQTTSDSKVEVSFGEILHCELNKSNHLVTYTVHQNEAFPEPQMRQQSTVNFNSIPWHYTLQHRIYSKRSKSGHRVLLWNLIHTMAHINWLDGTAQQQLWVIHLSSSYLTSCLNLETEPLAYLNCYRTLPKHTTNHCSLINTVFWLSRLSKILLPVGLGLPNWLLSTCDHSNSTFSRNEKKHLGAKTFYPHMHSIEPNFFNNAVASTYPADEPVFNKIKPLLNNPYVAVHISNNNNNNNSMN